MAEEKPTPVLFEHCLTVYGGMKKRAKLLPREDEEGHDEVYEGHLTRLFQELRMSAPYYTTVMNALKDMGCVEQTRRGGGNAMSRWILVNEPSVDRFNEREQLKGPTNGRVAALEQQVRSLSERMLRAEAAIGLRL